MTIDRIRRSRSSTASPTPSWTSSWPAPRRWRSSPAPSSSPRATPRSPGGCSSTGRSSCPGTWAARTSWSVAWTCRAGGPAACTRGTRRAATWPPAAASSPAALLRVPAEVLRDRMSAWFPLGGHLINGLYGTARSIESTARQRDSLVTLGTLAAGLAHELNNPAAAATRSVQAMEETCDVPGRLHRQARPGQPVRRPVPGARAAAPRAARPPADHLGARPLRPRGGGRRLGRRLGVDDAWTLTPPLAAQGADVAWCRHGGRAAPAPRRPARHCSGSPACCRCTPCSARSATRRTGSPSSSGRCAPTPRWTAPPPSGCWSPRASTAPW